MFVKATDTHAALVVCWVSSQYCLKVICGTITRKELTTNGDMIPLSAVINFMLSSCGSLR